MLDLGTLTLPCSSNRLLHLGFKVEELLERHLVDIHAGHTSSLSWSSLQSIGGHLSRSRYSTTLFAEVGLLFTFHLVNRFRLHFTPLHALCNRHAKTVRFSHAFQKSGKKPRRAHFLLAH